MYSFTVPTGADTYSSETAAVVLATRSGGARSHFTVARAALEVYPAHRSVRAGQLELIRLIGPPKTRVRLQILLPDGRYVARVLHLDASGRTTFDYHVSAIRGHPASHTTAIQAILSLPAGDYVATARFVIT